MGQSLAAQFAALPADEQARRIDALTPDEQAALAYDWAFWARPAQLWPEGLWRVWLLLAGRGFGKTRTGAETVRDAVENRGYSRIALVGPTAADVRDVMVEGESGLLAISPPWNRPVYEPSKRRVTWPNGAIATCYSADEPERLRGPQHDFFWADEVAAWRYKEAWDQLMFGLRLGHDPRGVATTTPKPKALVRELLSSPTVHTTRGSTYDNSANLADAFLDTILAKYEGTTLGRQEIHAEVLDETPGALWTRELLQGTRIDTMPSGLEVVRIGVAIDPAVTNSDTSDETGIMAGVLGEDGHGYLIEDASLRNTPMKWAQAAIELYHRRNADRMIGEVNNGGDLVETVVRQIDADVSYKPVRASHGKYARAEPIAALYEQHRIHHVGHASNYSQLEDEQCNWMPGIGWSPNRMDALVWLFTELMLGPDGRPVAAPGLLQGGSGVDPAGQRAADRRAAREAAYWGSDDDENDDGV